MNKRSSFSKKRYTTFPVLVLVISLAYFYLTGELNRFVGSEFKILMFLLVVLLISVLFAMQIQKIFEDTLNNPANANIILKATGISNKKSGDTQEILKTYAKLEIIEERISKKRN